MRAVRFTDVDPEHLERPVQRRVARRGPPEGVGRRRIQLMHDPDQRTAIVVQFFETEQDMRDSEGGARHGSVGDAEGRGPPSIAARSSSSGQGSRQRRQARERRPAIIPGPDGPGSQAQDPPRGCARDRGAARDRARLHVVQRLHRGALAVRASREEPDGELTRCTATSSPGSIERAANRLTFEIADREDPKRRSRSSTRARCPTRSARARGDRRGRARGRHLRRREGQPDHQVPVEVLRGG